MRLSSNPDLDYIQKQIDFERERRKRNQMRKTITIPNDINQDLTELSKREGITQSTFISMALDYYIDTKNRMREHPIKRKTKQTRKTSKK